MRVDMRVYYENTDAGGVVYHAQYLHFFERARTEFLRQLGFSQQALLTQQLAFVVKKLEIDYKVAARLDDLVSVETQLHEVKKATMVFIQRLWRDKVCLCEAMVTIASVNLNKMKPIAIPQDIVQAMYAVK